MKSLAATAQQAVPAHGPMDASTTMQRCNTLFPYGRACSCRVHHIHGSGMSLRGSDQLLHSVREQHRSLAASTVALPVDTNELGSRSFMLLAVFLTSQNVIQHLIVNL